MVDFPTKESVFGTRAIPRSRRSAQGYEAGVPEQAAIRAADRIAAGADALADAAIRSGQQTSRAADRYAKMAADIDALQEKRNTELEKLSLAKMQSYVLQQTTDLDMKVKQSPYVDRERVWKEGMSKIIPEAMKFAPQGDFQKQLAFQSLQDINIKGQANAKQSAYDGHSLALINDYDTEVDNLSKTLAVQAQNGDENAMLATVGTMRNLGKPLVDTMILDPMKAKTKVEGAVTSAIKSLPPEQAWGMVKGNGGFHAPSSVASIIKNTIKIEGGYAPIDGATNAPVIFGINAKDFPNQFKEAKKINDTQGPAAGREYAEAFYKNEFYDKYNIGQFQPDVQQVLFDGMVNHWAGFRPKLIEAAKSGKSASELIDMREAEYARLIKANPQKYKKSERGWASRISDMRSVVGAGGATGVAANLSLDTLNSLQKELLPYAQKPIKEEVSKIDDAAQLGRRVDKSFVENLAVRAEQVEMPDVAEALRKFNIIQDDASAFGKIPLKQQEASLESMQKSGNLEDNDRYKAYSAIYENKVKLLNSDPSAYYSGAGIIPEFVPIDLNADFSAEIEARRDSVKKVMALEGFAIPLLSDNEIKQIKAVYDDGKPGEAAGVVQKLGHVLTEDERRSLSQVVAKDSPMMAAAMALPSDHAKIVLEGSKLIGEVSADKLRAAVNLEIGGTIYEAEQLEGVQSAVYAAYKKLSLDDGDTEDTVNTDRMKKAINMVIGKPVDISPGMRASRVFTYKDENGKDVSANKIEDILSSLSDPALTTLNGTLPYDGMKNVVKAEEILREGQFVTSGDGLFIIRIPGLGDLIDENGRPYEINARALEKLQKENPLIMGVPFSNKNTREYNSLVARGLVK